MAPPPDLEFRDDVLSTLGLTVDDLPALRACLDAQFVCDAEVARGPIIGSAAFTRASGNLPRRSALPLTVQQAMVRAANSSEDVALSLIYNGKSVRHVCTVSTVGGWCSTAFAIAPGLRPGLEVQMVSTQVDNLPLVTSCESAPAVVPDRPHGKLTIAGVDFTCTPETEATAKIRGAMEAAAVSGNRVVLTLEHNGQPFVRPCSDVRACHGEPGLYAVAWDPPGWGVRGLYDVVRDASVDDPGLPLVTAVEPDRAEEFAKGAPYAAEQIRGAMTGETLYPGDIGVTWGLGISKERMAEVGSLAAVDEALDLFKRTGSRGPTLASDGWNAKWSAMGSRITADDLPENATGATAASADPVWMVATIDGLKQRLARGEWPLVRAAATARLHSAPVEGRLVSIDDPGPLCATTMGTVMHVDGRDRSPIDMEARSLEVWTVPVARSSPTVLGIPVDGGLLTNLETIAADPTMVLRIGGEITRHQLMVADFREAIGAGKSDTHEEAVALAKHLRSVQDRRLAGHDVSLPKRVEPSGRDVAAAIGNTLVLARSFAVDLMDSDEFGQWVVERAATLIATLDRVEAETSALFDPARNSEAAAQVPTP
jgi:hypothetical protein